MNPTPGPLPVRVLAVDDEEIVLVALRETLRQQGYSVVTAQGVVEGLERLQKESFAVILSDQMMPGLTGLEFLAQARKLQPEASRLLITAELNVNTVIDAINKAEIFRFILKPWQRDEFLGTVKAAAERHQALVRVKERLALALAENDCLRTRIKELERLVGETRPD
ncbi:MAG TPA: response regulator [Methylomirabilota bacterium]|nr:response regulator [Methylomirabilota bacterium]